MIDFLINNLQLKGINYLSVWIEMEMEASFSFMLEGTSHAEKLKKSQSTKRNLEGIFLELNLRKHKVLPFVYTTTVK